MACIGCGRGFHEECLNSPCCCKVDESKPVEVKQLTVSAGRKRAAVDYPIENSTDPCEWRALANCGGGLNPIIGCITGVQQHRHHGPIKDTLRNEKGNVHKICTSCHNLWHRRNDEVYDEDTYSTLPHNPREATPNEMLRRGN